MLRQYLNPETADPKPTSFLPCHTSPLLSKYCGPSGHQGTEGHPGERIRISWLKNRETATPKNTERESRNVSKHVSPRNPLLVQKYILTRLRPYHPERAGSRLISEAKQGRAWLVLGWEKCILTEQFVSLPPPNIGCCPYCISWHN